MKKFIKENWFTIVAEIMLILAIPAIWPYGYFQLLRWVVAIVAVYNAYLAYESKNNKWVLIMGAIAVLFNPIAPIFLQKETWVILDLIVGVFFVLSMFLIRTKK